jgi:hypothetical protein
MYKIKTYKITKFIRLDGVNYNSGETITDSPEILTANFIKDIIEDKIAGFNSVNLVFENGVEMVSSEESTHLYSNILNENRQASLIASEQDLLKAFIGDNTPPSGLPTSAKSELESGIEFTGGFAGKPTSASYVWEEGTGISIGTSAVTNQIFQTFSFDRDVHLAVDTPYWTDPTPADHTDKGVFGGSYLPIDVPTVFDYTSVDSDTYEDGSNAVTTGRIDMSNFKVGDTIRVRFDYNAIPQIANTTIEPAIWYKNRDANDDVTFTFPLTSNPVFYGTGTVGKSYLNRSEISVYVASQEDINALAYLAIKSDNLITIQPLSVLLTVIR